MPRRHIYVKSKLDQRILDAVQIEIQNGASEKDTNYSSLCNELISYGFMIYKPKGEREDELNLMEFRRDLIRKVAGTREGAMIMTCLLSEIYLRLMGEDAMEGLEELINHNLSQISNAENKAEAAHFLAEENDE